MVFGFTWRCMLPSFWGNCGAQEAELKRPTIVTELSAELCFFFLSFVDVSQDSFYFICLLLVWSRSFQFGRLASFQTLFWEASTKSITTNTITTTTIDKNHKKQNNSDRESMNFVQFNSIQFNLLFHRFNSHVSILKKDLSRWERECVCVLYSNTFPAVFCVALCGVVRKKKKYNSISVKYA